MNLIAALLGLILFLIIVGVCFWALQQIVALIPLPQPFATLVWVAMVLVGVIIAVLVFIWLLNLAGLHVTLPHLGGDFRPIGTLALSAFSAGYYA